MKRSALAILCAVPLVVLLAILLRPSRPSTVTEEPVVASRAASVRGADVRPMSAAKPPSRLHLQGIVAANNERLALVSVGSDRATWHRVDDVVDDARLIAIDNRSVTLERDGSREVLTFVRQSPDAATTSAARSPVAMPSLESRAPANIIMAPPKAASTRTATPEFGN